MIKKLIVISILFFSFTAHAAPPSRVSTYTTGTVISSTAVTANEDALFNYLSAGVDTYSDGTIVNADVNSSANIQSDKLNLTSIAQAVGITSAGSFTNGGATTLNGAVTLGDAIGDTLVIDAGAWTLTNATTFTLTGALTFSGTIADLGIVTTADINGGTLDGVQIGGTTATGELIVNNATDDADGLGSQGTSGQFLQSAGTGANPTWANAFGKLISTTTHAGDTNTGNIVIEPSKRYLVTMVISATTATEPDVSLRFNSSATATGYAWNGQGSTFATTPVTTIDGDDSDSEINMAKLISSGGYVDQIGVSSENGFIRGYFYIDTNKISTVYSAFVTGAFLAIARGPVLTRAEFAGLNKENLTITDFELVFTTNCSFTIKLYELD